MVEFNEKDFKEIVEKKNYDKLTEKTDFKVILIDFGLSKDLKSRKDPSSQKRGNELFAS